MKSSIKIDYVDRGTGRSIEPVIRVELIQSEDPRDTLIQHLFESMMYGRFIQFTYSNHKTVVSTESGLQNYEKTILLFRPEFDVENMIEVVYTCFREWILNEKFILQKEGKYKRGKEIVDAEILLERFIKLKSTPPPEG